MTPNIAAGASKTYSLTLQNTAGAGTTPLVHCYRWGGKGVFSSPDASYTVGHPAVADSAIAVGAWTQRKSWTDYQGNGWQYSDLTVGTLAPFSSLGPRLDGVRKPDIVAPGAATISARDSVSGLAATAAFIIDNDGLNLNGSGPANYYVMRGTSMACPMAAGVAALLLQNNPSLTPTQVKNALTSTASMVASPNNSVGYGLIDALAAIKHNNQAPVLSNVEGTALAYTENAAATNITTAIMVSDADSANMASGSVQITANYQNGQDVLSYTQVGSIVGTWNSTTGTMGLSGSDTKANYQLALRAVKYANSSDNPSTLTRTVTSRSTTARRTATRKPATSA